MASWHLVDKRVVISGREKVFRVLSHPGAVAVIPWRDGQMALIRQLRPAVDEVIWEIPAGTLEAGEQPEACAARELQEETGYTAACLTKLAEFYLAPGYSSEYMHVYAATGLTPGERQLDDGEAIEPPTWFPLTEVQAMVARGEIKDAKTIVAAYLAQQLLS
jgi:ADP-ribose pyrophosphatase